MSKSANDALLVTREDHNWKHEPLDMNSTGGIQRTIRALEAQIKALADYIDGKPTDADKIEADKPRRTFKNRLEDTDTVNPTLNTPVPAQPNPVVPAV